MIYIIGMACMTGTLSAQTVVDYSTFEQKVLDYSQTLKQSVAQRTAMQKAMKRFLNNHQVTASKPKIGYKPRR